MSDGTRNIALLLSYVGTRYHGWQIQKGLPTVQGTLKRAAEQVFGEAVTVLGCGRTDAGVHAERYVASFRADTRIPAGRVPYALNTRLPEDIVVRDARDVPEDFHPVFSSVWKEYTYRVLNAPMRDPFLAGRALHYPMPLRLDVMREAARSIEGEHDFKALRSEGSNVKTTVRTVFSCRVEETGGLVEIRVSANGFLYNMARTIAGTLLYVSEGKITPEGIDELFRSGDRLLAGPNLPAKGLYMTGVRYASPLFDEKKSEGERHGR